MVIVVVVVVGCTSVFSLVGVGVTAMFRVVVRVSFEFGFTGRVFGEPIISHFS